jgi:hypothetical protein
MSDPSIVADHQLRHFGVTRGKRETTFPVEGHVVAYDYLAFSLDPMYVNAGVEIAPIPGAVRFEQRLADEDSPDEIINRPNQQKDAQGGHDQNSGSGNREILEEAIQI